MEKQINPLWLAILIPLAFLCGCCVSVLLGLAHDDVDVDFWKTAYFTTNIERKELLEQVMEWREYYDEAAK
jgi:predicted signal transduction protein with EAL and GGDEF domain